MEHPVSGKPASVTEQSFNCPHCGAYTSHKWARCFADRFPEKSPLPDVMDAARLEQLREYRKRAVNAEAKKGTQMMEEWGEKMLLGRPFTERNNGTYSNLTVYNVHFSSCYVCEEISIWVADKLLYPPVRGGDQPNSDLPDDIKADFEEARSILDLSPRGAAALLRLCVQKLCKHLGEKGSDINEDIASLVRKGLDTGIQQALDSVRVIGNQAVHPGKMDLRDDKATASELFMIVNFIADEMISKKKRLAAIYKKLPQGAIDAIAKRDAKATTGTPP